MILFAVLYFAQGAVQSYLSNFQKPYLLDGGISLEKIGLLSSLMLIPFSIKIVFAWASDRFTFLGDQRKSYMLLGLFVAASSFALMVWIDPATQFNVFLGFIILSSAAMALFDSCTDGLAVDVSNNNTEAGIQSAMMVGRGLGYIILSIVFGKIIFSYGYPFMFSCLSMVLTSVFILTYIYCPKSSTRNGIQRKNFLLNIKNFLSKNSRPLLILIIAGVYYSITLYGVDGIISIYAKMNLKMNEEQIGKLGAFQGCGSIIGALSTYLMVKYLGLKRATYISIGAVVFCGIFLAQTQTIQKFYIAILAWGCVWGIQETVFLTLATKISQSALGATVFAALMMASNIGVSIGEGLAPQMIRHLQIKPTMVYLSMAHIGVAVLIFLYFRSISFKLNKS